MDMKRINIIFICFILLFSVLMISTISASNNTTGHFNVITTNSKYEVGDSYDFELLDNKGEYISGKTVNININGKNHYVKTNGSYSLKLKNLGTYKLKINTYKSGLNVKGFNRTITVSAMKGHFVLINNSNSYEVGGYFNFKLLNKHNKLIKNQRINIQLDGKNHIVTSASGIYKFKVNKVIGKYKLKVNTLSKKLNVKSFSKTFSTYIRMETNNVHSDSNHVSIWRYIGKYKVFSKIYSSPDIYGNHFSDFWSWVTVNHRRLYCNAFSVVISIKYYNGIVKTFSNSFFTNGADCTGPWTRLGMNLPVNWRNVVNFKACFTIKSLRYYNPKTDYPSKI